MLPLGKQGIARLNLGRLGEDEGLLCSEKENPHHSHRVVETWQHE